MKHILSLFAFVMLAITTISFASCSKEEENGGFGEGIGGGIGGGTGEFNPTFSDVILQPGETKIMKGTKDFVWKSSNEQVAILRNDTLYGRSVGTATLTSKAGSFKVKVVPQSSGSFKEPYLEFGASPSNIKAWMKANVPTATLDEYISDAEMLVYECNQGAVQEYSYSLIGHYGYKAGTLSMVLIIVDSSYKKEVVDFLKGKYTIVDSSNQDLYIMLASPELNRTVMIQLGYTNNLPVFTISYMPYIFMNRSAINSDLYKSLIKPTQKTPELEAAFKDFVNSFKAAQ